MQRVVTEDKADKKMINYVYNIDYRLQIQEMQIFLYSLSTFAIAPTLSKTSCHSFAALE